MDVVLVGYSEFLAGVRTVLFWLAAAMAVIAVADWAVRTRRVSPFGPMSRFMRARVDPFMAPVERSVVRAGGRTTTVPWWALVAVIVIGLLLIFVLDFVGNLLGEIVRAAATPALLPALLVSWLIGLVEIALLVRVIASWVNVSPWSRWVRWSFVLTEWLLAPLRRFIPPLGMIDFTPLIAYFILALLRPIIVNSLARIAGVG